MSLENDLLDQAEHLARLDPRKPKQANLRRAVSSAYYALFHLLIRECSSQLTSNPRLQRSISRVFGHGEMKQINKQFLQKNLPKHIANAAGTTSAPEDLKFVAEVFIELQETRHDADYNLNRVFIRSDIIAFIEKTRTAFVAWKRVRMERVTSIYLLALTLGERWKY